MTASGDFEINPGILPVILFIIPSGIYGRVVEILHFGRNLIVLRKNKG